MSSLLRAFVFAVLYNDDISQVIKTARDLIYPLRSHAKSSVSARHLRVETSDASAIRAPVGMSFSAICLEVAAIARPHVLARGDSTRVAQLRLGIGNFVICTGLS
jgi:hypothetical protein